MSLPIDPVAFRCELLRVDPGDRDTWADGVLGIDELPEETVMAGLDRHIELHTERLHYLRSVIASIESGEHPMIQARSSSLDAEGLRRLQATRSMIFGELATAAEQEIASAERIRRFWREELAGSGN